MSCVLSNNIVYTYIVHMIHCLSCLCGMMKILTLFTRTAEAGLKPDWIQAICLMCKHCQLAWKPLNLILIQHVVWSWIKGGLSVV